MSWLCCVITRTPRSAVWKLQSRTGEVFRDILIFAICWLHIWHETIEWIKRKFNQKSIYLVYACWPWRLFRNVLFTNTLFKKAPLGGKVMIFFFQHTTLSNIPRNVWCACVGPRRYTCLKHTFHQYTFQFFNTLLSKNRWCMYVGLGWHTF